MPGSSTMNSGRWGVVNQVANTGHWGYGVLIGGWLGVGGARDGLLLATMVTGTGHEVVDGYELGSGARYSCQ